MSNSSLILFRPLEKSLKNRIARYRIEPPQLLKDTTLGLLLLTFSLIIYFSSLWALRQLMQNQTLSIPPSLPLTFSFNIFLPLVFFAALSGILSHFFYSEDLELLLSSPISRVSFFLERILLVSLETSWMTILSLLPFLLSFSIVYNASFFYYLLIPFYLIIFILIPTAIALIFGLVWGLLISKIPSGLILFVFIAGGGYLSFEFVSLLSFYLSDTDNLSSTFLLGGLSKISDFGSYWSPGTWLSRGLAPFLALPDQDFTYSSREQLIYFLSGFLAALSTLTGLLCAGFILYSLFYTKALSLVWGKEKKIFKFSENTYDKISVYTRKLVPDFLKQDYALLRKELIDFLRDPSQLVQIFFLLGILGIYLYVLQFQQNIYPLIKGLSPTMWERLVLFLNLLLECFMIVAITTRLVFPSISREGRTIWILQTGPVSLKKIIYSKFYFWLLPVSLVLVTLGYFSFYLQYQIHTIACIKGVITLSTVSVITGLALYTGSHFSYFTWESRSQLIANFGNIVFMVFALIISSIIIIFTIPVLLNLVKNPEQFFKSMLFLTAIICFNVTLTSFFLKRAHRSLERRLFNDKA